MELLKKSDGSDLRPEGPAFNSHAREGVDQELRKLSAEGAEQKSALALSVGPSGLKIDQTTSTPSRAWLLDTGPSGLRSS